MGILVDILYGTLSKLNTYFRKHNGSSSAVMMKIKSKWWGKWNTIETKTRLEKRREREGEREKKGENNIERIQRENKFIQ